jgi:hypothetical protein
VQQSSSPKKTPMLWNLDRERLFGKFAFVNDPQPGNPEHIRITDDWANKNLVHVSIDVLPDGAQHGVHLALFHRLVAPSFVALLEAWDEAGLLGHIISWDGSYAPRYKRGRAPGKGLPPAPAMLSAHCLPASSRVWTAEGPADIAELQGYTGKLFSYSDGSVVQGSVSSHFKNGKQPVLEIVARRHRLRCTPNHPVLVLRKKTLSADAWIQHPIGRGAQRALYWTPPSSSAILDGDWAETLGMFLGDGAVHHRHEKPVYVSFSIPAEDRIRAHAESLLRRTLGDGLSVSDRGLFYYRDAVTSRFLPYDRYARSKSIPAEVFCWPREMQRRFVLGLLYTDGTLTESHTRAGNTSVVFRWKMGSLTLIEGLKQLLTMLGLVPSAITISPAEIRTIKGVQTFSQDAYVLGARDPHGVLSPDADPVYLRRLQASTWAQARSTHCWGYQTVSPDFTHEPVSGIRYLGEEDVFDVEVPGPHNFISDGVVVSNSWGSAFDLNARWNPLGRAGALPGHEGSMWDLAEVAEELGWVWGGRWSVPDAMHLECSERCIAQGVVKAAP